jgi:hypothetical protein
MNHGHGHWDEEATERFWKTLVAISSTEMVYSLRTWKTKFGPAFGAASEFLGQVKGGKNRCSRSEGKDFPEAISFWPRTDRWGDQEFTAKHPGIKNNVTENAASAGVHFQLTRFLKRLRSISEIGALTAGQVTEIAPNVFWLGRVLLDEEEVRVYLSLDPGTNLQMLLEDLPLCKFPPPSKRYPDIYIVTESENRVALMRIKEECKRLGSYYIRTQDIFKINRDVQCMAVAAPLGAFLIPPNDPIEILREYISGSGFRSEVPVSLPPPSEVAEDRPEQDDQEISLCQDQTKQRSKQEDEEKAELQEEYTELREVNEFRLLAGKMWFVRFQGRKESYVPNSAGMPHVACLLANPRKEWRVEDLDTEVNGGPPEEDAPPDNNLVMTYGTGTGRKRDALVKKKDIPSLKKALKELNAKKNEYEEQDFWRDDETYESLETQIKMINRCLTEAYNTAAAKDAHNKLVNRTKVNFHRALEAIALAEYKTTYPDDKKPPRTMKQAEFSPDDTPLAFHLLKCIETPVRNRCYCYRPDITISWKT